MRARWSITAVAVLSACQTLLEVEPTEFRGNDAGTDGDAGARDGMGASEAGAGAHWCEALDASPALCVDFDRSPITDGWEVLETPDASGAAIVGDEGAFVSAPASALARMPPVVGTGEARARMCKTLPLSRDNLSWTFHMRVQQAYSNTSGSLASLRLLSTAANDALYTDLRLQPPAEWHLTTRRFNDPDAGVRNLLAHPVPLDTWSRIRFELTLTSRVGPTTGSVRLLIEDGAEASVEATMSLEAAFEVDMVQICFGLVYADVPTGPWMLRYDNMTFDMR